MQFSHRQSPQYNTRGKLTAVPVSESVNSELQRTQCLKSPRIKKFSRFLRLPPSKDYETGS